MPIIYIDVLFVVNLLINYILLRACSVFSGLKINKYRILLGAFIGACYAVLIFFPNFSVIYSTICKMLISMLIVAASFPFYSIRSYIKALLIFYIVSFGFGGCVLGIFYFSDVGTKLGAVYSNGVLYFNLPWTILALAGTLFYIAIKLFAFFSGRTYKVNNLRKKLYLSFGENTAEITALLDTGNSLVDPVSLSPVIIAEYRQLKNLFSEDIRITLDKIGCDNLTWIMSDVAEKGLPARLIPFSSLGKSNGMLIGFVPDRAEIRDDCGVRVLEKCVVGLYNQQLSKDRSYAALLNPYL
jgi:stage II sporulation protein GA (sporulation sigma-E factor processing peptidase)